MSNHTPPPENTPLQPPPQPPPAPITRDPTTHTPSEAASPPPFAPPPAHHIDGKTPGDMGIGITVGILGNVVWMALMLASSLSGYGQAMLGLLFVGVSQFIWIAPLALYWHTQGQSRNIGGLMTVAGVVFLLNFVLIGGFIAFLYTVCGKN
jgi:hypothetical protein